MAIPRHLRIPALLLLCGAAVHAQGGGLEVLPVQGQVHLLVGPGGNTTLQVGDEGVVVVDTQTASVSDGVLEAVRALGTKPIRHIILTSADAGHTGGTEALSRAGTHVRLIDSFDPRGESAHASVFAHINVLTRMSAPTGTEALTPAGAWPTDTYFTDEWAIFVNGEAIRLLHVPNAHTDGDTMVFFRRSDVISTGDIFNTDRYPAFDASRGGSIEGIIEGLNMVLDVAIPGENQEGGTAVVPGHGRLGDETDVANYRDMVTIVRDRVQASIDENRTLDEVLAAGLTRDYDGIYATTPDGWTGRQFVEAVYLDLKAQHP